MQTINKKDLIPILINSVLCDQFPEDNIIIPTKYVLSEINITDLYSFYEVMNKLRYYMLEEMPREIYDYVIKNKPNLSDFKDFFFEELTLLKETKKDKLINECANKGYLNLMKYLHENGCSWDLLTCSYAASRGHLDCLKYAHENGCSWDSTTCSSAALYGHLDCLKYLHENGCQCDKQECINEAKENDHKEIIDYLESI